MSTAGAQASTAVRATAPSAACQVTPSEASPTTRAPSRGLAPWTPGRMPATWLAPKTPSSGQRVDLLPHGRDGADQQTHDRELVAHGDDDALGEHLGPGQRARGEHPGPQPVHDQAGDEQDEGEAAGRDQQLGRQGGAGGDDEDGEPDRADQPVQADLGDRARAGQADALQAVHAPQVGADVGRRGQPDQLALRVGPQVPAPGPAWPPTGSASGAGRGRTCRSPTAPGRSAPASRTRRAPAPCSRPRRSARRRGRSGAPSGRGGPSGRAGHSGRRRRRSRGGRQGGVCGVGHCGGYLVDRCPGVPASPGWGPGGAYPFGALPTRLDGSGGRIPRCGRCVGSAPWETCRRW